MPSHLVFLKIGKVDFTTKTQADESGKPHENWSLFCIY